MLQHMIWFILIYLVSALLVHLAKVRAKYALNQPVIIHYIVITDHHQAQIEWIMRSLICLAWIKGNSLKITVIDRGSTDDTLAIVGKLARHSRVDIQVIANGHSNI